MRELGHRGVDVGQWVTRRRPLVQQSQVLLCNVVAVLGNLSAALLRTVLNSLAQVRQVLGHASLLQHVAAALLRLSVPPRFGG